MQTPEPLVIEVRRAGTELGHTLTVAREDIPAYIAKYAKLAEKAHPSWSPLRGDVIVANRAALALTVLVSALNPPPDENVLLVVGDEDVSIYSGMFDHRGMTLH